jgi:hypothetical protein
MTCDANDPSTIAEHRDALAHLSASGFDRLLAAMEDPRCYATDGPAAGQVSARGISRVTGLSQKRARAMLRAARESLGQ